MPDPTTTITLTVPARWPDFVRAALATEAQRDASDLIAGWIQNGEHSALALEQAAVMRDVARQFGTPTDE